MKYTNVIPEGSKLIPIYPLKNNDYALVDIATAEKYKGVKFYWMRGGRYIGAVINGKRVYLHHLVIGNPPKGLQTDHINQLRDDNRSCNLRHISHRDNVRNGVITKLTIEKVQRIKFALSMGIKGSQIAKTFGISHPHVTRIKRGICWGDVV